MQKATMGLLQSIQINSKKRADVVMTNVASISLRLMKLCGNNFGNFDNRWYSGNNGLYFVKLISKSILQIAVCKNIKNTHGSYLHCKF